jgi:DNA-binding transcriptional MerR regulator
MENALPAIPAKRYFTIGEVSVLCGVKPYVLRYWEQEFTQLKPVKRRGNRRYYQHHEVLLIRRIRELLYDQGFTISGARNRLAEQTPVGRSSHSNGERLSGSVHSAESASAGAMAVDVDEADVAVVAPHEDDALPLPEVSEVDLTQLRNELLSIRRLLDG